MNKSGSEQLIAVGWNTFKNQFSKLVCSFCLFADIKKNSLTFQISKPKANKIQAA